MVIEIPNRLLEKAQLTEPEMLLKIAVALYQDQFFTLGQAAEFAGLPKAIFQIELGKRGVLTHYSEEMLRQDFEIHALAA